MKRKRLAGFSSVILFLALLPGLALAQTPEGDPQTSIKRPDIEGPDITLRLELPPYEIKQNEEGIYIIQVEGFSLSGSPGDPWLPREVYNIAVPPNAALDSLSLEVVDVQVTKLRGSYRLKMASPDLTCEGVEDDVSMRQSDYGSTSDTAPADFARLLSPGQMRKWRFARLEFVPFQYDAASGELSVASELTVRINYDSISAAKDKALLQDRVMDDTAKQLFVNYDAAQVWYRVTSGEESLGTNVSRDKQSQDEPGVVYDYVIITTNAIETGSSKLADFVLHKQSQLYSVLTITEDEYGGLTGQPPDGTAEKIRKWLQDNYTTYSIKYVLLIGNPDPSGDVPMKMCWPRHGAGSDEESPTDYFFADLTGNWDLDGDQFFGEWGDDTGAGGVDFANEVYVGRIPVYGADYATLDNILQKIMDYENEPNPESWRESVLFPMSFSTTTYDGAPLAEQIMDDYVTAAGFATWTQYQQGNGACNLDSIYSSDEELRGGTVVRDRWAANDYGLVLWWAHGSATSASVGCDGCWDGTLFNNTQTTSLDDDHPSFTYQCSCLNGYPENSNNLQYAILKQGGIGTVSASRVSWFNTGVGYGDFDGSTTNSGIGYEYAKRLVEGQAASDALYNAKASMTPEFDTRLMNFYDFNLYGDPSTGLAQAADNTVLIIQDQYPWGYDSVQQVLNNHGIGYDQTSSSLIPTIDLSLYELVIIPSNQDSGFYTTWNTNIAKFEAYVEAGGALWLSTCAYSSTSPEPLVPGGVINATDLDYYNDIVYPTHPWVAGVPDPMYGNFASHDSFTNLYPGSLVVAKAQTSGNPTLVDYAMGEGRVLITGQTLEFAWGAGWDGAPILQNSLLDMLAWPSGMSDRFFDDMESGINGWATTGFWHQVQQGVSPYPEAHSPTHSWWYGQDATGDYDNGAQNSGDLTSPSIYIPTAGHGLRFWYWYETEDTYTSWDQKWVQVSANGGPFNNVAQVSGPPMLSWVPSQIIDLSAYAGDTIQVRFYFDTIDSVGNAYRGWYVDDFWVANVPPSLSGLPDQIIDHTASLPIVIDLWAYASDAETPDSGLAYAVVGSPPSGAGVSIASNRWLTVNPSTSWCGYTDVTVRVTDPGGLWDEDVLRVAVTWSCQG